ncbi:MAG TPA: hypothetical protein DEB69_01125 [Candidatus Komeilibacteria bacterium]|nr:hypothetical protein [Candidatus Komeilibacteria bacterium]
MTEKNHKKHVLKKDRHSKNRGGNSRFLDIFCSACNSHVALYQKDGPGALLRMYLDRIFAPVSLATLQDQGGGKKDLLNLQCPKCSALIGTPMVYELESRLAFRLVRGSFAKKNSDGTYPPTKP